MMWWTMDKSGQIESSPEDGPQRSKMYFTLSLIFQAATTVLRMFNVLRLCHKCSAMKIVHHKNPPYFIIEERPLTGTNKAEKI